MCCIICLTVYNVTHAANTTQHNNKGINMEPKLPLRTRVHNVKQLQHNPDAARELAIQYRLRWTVLPEQYKDGELFMPVYSARSRVVRLIRTVGVYKCGKYALNRTRKGVSVRIYSDWNDADYKLFLSLLVENGYNAVETKSGSVLLLGA